MLESLNAWLQGLSLGVAYLIILILSAIIYQQAFARRLPLLKSLIVYLALAVGCLLLTLFHLMRFPMIPILFFTVIMIIVTKLRLRSSKSNESK